ncbi:MAG: hypothetical protein ACU85V_01595 [Gammaproteobacteria bacterium]
MRRPVYRFAITAVLIVTVTSGCTQFGPRIIEASRTDYNVAMARTESEQMLLNLVRLRYGDEPYFLEASALNTQFLISPRAEADSAFNFDGSTLYSIGGSLVYEEKPTVTYTPLRGEDFVRQVLSRVSLETFLLLDSSGWRTERVLRLCVERLNDLDNASRASGPTPTEAPAVGDFRRAAELFSGLVANGGLRTYRVEEDDEKNYVTRVSEAKANSADFAEFATLLGLDPERREFDLLLNRVGDPRTSITIETRSFMGVMYFLSQSVVVPAEDAAAGRVRVTLDGAGQAFDWDAVTGGLLRIASSRTRPANAAVAVSYRGAWFYIDDTDLESKSSFALLGQLYALQSKDNADRAPLLTLPVGG